MAAFAEVNDIPQVRIKKEDRKAVLAPRNSPTREPGADTRAIVLSAELQNTTEITIDHQDPFSRSSRRIR